MKKIGMVSLGCPKNLVDTEIMLGLLADEGYSFTNDESEADIIIINTCGFIEPAKQESINTILDMAEYKKQNCRMLIVTGCLSERYNETLAEQIPEIDAIVGTGDYGNICEIIKTASEGNKPLLYGKLDEISYLENGRKLSSNSTYAYLKIAEGCDNHCTYCVIPSLRGKYRSRAAEDIIKEAKWLASQGIKEIILIAQDTTKYGIDIYSERRLPHLIREISKLPEIVQIRILYGYPEDITDELIEEFAANDKLAKYLDIPIQHLSDKILKMMGRKETNSSISHLIQKLRDRIPEIVIRTTLIAGFPGEDDADHAKMAEGVRRLKFDRLGVFVYSNEEGTPASRLKNKVPNKISDSRRDELMSIQSKITLSLNKDRIGKIYYVIAEGISDDGIFYFGRTYAEAPEIDGLVYFTSQEPVTIGNYVKVKILDADTCDLTGEVI